MRVAILGCGPAGLIAAHAIETEVPMADIRIFSKRRKSELFGAQYLHEPIPNINTREPVLISYRIEGSSEGYRSKVYGDKWVSSVSPEDLAGDHYAWDLRETYNLLWEAHWDRIEDTDLSLTKPEDLQAMESAFDLVISSVPADVLCRNEEHAFRSEQIWAAGDAPERGVFAPFSLPKNNLVVCNGNSEPAWYRASKVFGHNTVEWPANRKPPIDNVAEVRKPLSTTCDCFPHIKRVGRYGRWEKGVLSHTAYKEARSAINIATMP